MNFQNMCSKKNFENSTFKPFHWKMFHVGHNLCFIDVVAEGFDTSKIIHTRLGFQKFYEISMISNILKI